MMLHEEIEGRPGMIQLQTWLLNCWLELFEGFEEEEEEEEAAGLLLLMPAPSFLHISSRQHQHHILIRTSLALPWT